MKSNIIKVLHIVLSMETGGLENGIVNLINNSDQDKFIVDVLCLREKGKLANRIENTNSQVIFDGNHNPSLLTAIKKIMVACNSGDYDIVHTHGFTTMLSTYIASFFVNRPIIINGEHGTLYYSSFKKRILQKWLFRAMDINLTVSSELKTKILHEFRLSFDNFKPIINGVDSTTFNPKNNSTVRHDLNIPDQDIVIGSVGRLVNVKNYPSLIKAFHHVLENNKNTHLVLAGDGPERKILEKLVTALDINKNVHFLGNRNDIPSVMNCMDLFVLPSFSEGLSNTLLEAMSSGVPVIASDVGGNSEIIKTNISGFLYPSNDVNALSETLLSLCNSPIEIKRISASARKHIVNNFTLQSMVENYEIVYEQLFSTKYNKLKNV